MAQSAKNHLRLYPLHHFFITPLSIIVFIYSITELIKNTNFSNMFFVFTAILLFITPLLSRIYGLKNQDRIIRLEMRQRYFELTGKRFFFLENQLSLGQIIALRFAPDDELVYLIDLAIKNNLTPKNIKEKIKNWYADYNRI